MQTKESKTIKQKQNKHSLEDRTQDEQRSDRSKDKKRTEKERRTAATEKQERTQENNEERTGKERQLKCMTNAAMEPGTDPKQKQRKSRVLFAPGYYTGLGL